MYKITIRAAYDADAGVWYVADSSLPGVHAEGATLDELRAKLPAVISDLVEDDAGDLAIKLVWR